MVQIKQRLNRGSCGYQLIFTVMSTTIIQINQQVFVCDLFWAFTEHRFIEGHAVSGLVAGDAFIWQVHGEEGKVIGQHNISRRTDNRDFQLTSIEAGVILHFFQGEYHKFEKELRLPTMGGEIRHTMDQVPLVSKHDSKLSREVVVQVGNDEFCVAFFDYEKNVWRSNDDEVDFSDPSLVWMDILPIK